MIILFFMLAMTFFFLKEEPWLKILTKSTFYTAMFWAFSLVASCLGGC